MIIKGDNMETELLFTRRFKSETYKFYYNHGYGCLGLYDEYYSIETPANSFGYPDTILFAHGEPYALNRYLQPWILKACKNALIKKGYNVNK